LHYDIEHAKKLALEAAGLEEYYAEHMS